MKRAAANAPVTKPWAEFTAAEVMKSPVIAVSDRSLLAEAARALSEDRISGAVVNDHRSLPVGVVSMLDIVAALAGMDRPEGELGGFYRQGRLLPDVDDVGTEISEENPGDGVTVGEIMSPEILSVPVTATLDRVARMLHEKQIHRVFVRDGKGALVGVVSTMDLLRVLAQGTWE